MHAYMLTHICMYIYVYYMHIIYTWGFPGSSDSKEFTCNTGDPASLLGWEDPLEKGMAIHSSILA